MNVGIRHRHTAALGIVASLAGGVSLFLAFRFAIEEAGTALVGSWALIQGAFFLSRISDAGAGINITRMVAVSRSERGEIPLIAVIAAGLLLCVMPVILIGGILVAPVDWLLADYFRSTLPRAVIFELIFFSFVTAVLSSLSALLLSIIEGAGGLFHRYLVTIVSNVVLGASAYPLMTYFGPPGLGLVYVAAAGVQLLGGVILLPRLVPRRIRCRASTTQTIVSLWYENLKTSGMALVRLTFEPWTKFVVASTAGLGEVAALDLAVRVTTQVRVAVQAAMQPLLALGARSSMMEIDRIHVQYTRANELVVKANLVLAGSMVAGGPLVGWLGFGSVSSTFLLFFSILAVGNAINSIGIVGYYFAVSGGGVGRILKIQIIMMMINLVFGALGAHLLGSWAAVLAYAISFAYGGVAFARPWMDASGTIWGRLLRREFGGLVTAGLLVGAIGLYSVWPGLRLDSFSFIVGSTALGTAVFAVFALRNWRLFT